MVSPSIMRSAGNQASQTICRHRIKRPSYRSWLKERLFYHWRKWSHFQIPNQIYQNTLYIRKYIYAFGLWIQMVYMWLAFCSAKDPELNKYMDLRHLTPHVFFCKSTFADICGKLIFGVSPQNRRFWKMHRPSAAGTPWCEKNDGGGRWWNTCHIPIVCCNCVLVKSKHKRLKTFPNREWFEVLNHIYMNHGRVKVCFLLVCVISPKKQYWLFSFYVFPALQSEWNIMKRQCQHSLIYL